VLRAIENSGVSPDRERARVFQAAEDADITIQVGLTQGGTDGGRFAYWGGAEPGTVMARTVQPLAGRGTRPA